MKLTTDHLRTIAAHHGRRVLWLSACTTRAARAQARLMALHGYELKRVCEGNCTFDLIALEQAPAFLTSTEIVKVAA